MSDTTLTCVTCGRDEAPISGRVPFRNPLKDDVLSRVGAGCWARWLDQQVKIINEYRLNLAEPRARDVLEEQARIFLALGGAAEGQAEVGPDKARELGNL